MTQKKIKTEVMEVINPYNTYLIIFPPAPPKIEDPLQCKVCFHKCRTEQQLKIHLFKKHKEGTAYTCEDCSFIAFDTSTLQEHIDRKHKVEYKFFCEKCDEKFQKEQDFVRHLTSHEELPFECEECETCFVSSRLLSLHINRAHRKRKIYDCPHCTKKLMSKKSLEAHLLIHDQVFICEMCGSQFARKQALKCHLEQVHEEKSKYLCDVCGKVFKSLTNQQVHSLKHANKRPYVCEICGKSFTQRTPMMRHRKSHPGNHPPPPPVKVASILRGLDNEDDEDDEEDEEPYRMTTRRSAKLELDARSTED